MEQRISNLLTERRGLKAQAREIRRTLKLEQKKKKRLLQTIKHLSKQDVIDVIAACCTEMQRK